MNILDFFQVAELTDTGGGYKSRCSPKSINKNTGEIWAELGLASGGMYRRVAQHGTSGELSRDLYPGHTAMGLSIVLAHSYLSTIELQIGESELPQLWYAIWGYMSNRAGFPHRVFPDALSSPVLLGILLVGFMCGRARAIIYATPPFGSNIFSMLTAGYLRMDPLISAEIQKTLAQQKQSYLATVF